MSAQSHQASPAGYQRSNHFIDWLRDQRAQLALSVKQQRQLVDAFCTLQGPYERNKGDRKQFPSYAYVAYRLSEALGFPIEVCERMATLLPAASRLGACAPLWQRMQCDAEWSSVVSRVSCVV